MTVSEETSEIARPDLHGHLLYCPYCGAKVYSGWGANKFACGSIWNLATKIFHQSNRCRDTQILGGLTTTETRTTTRYEYDPNLADKEIAKRKEELAAAKSGEPSSGAAVQLDEHAQEKLILLRALENQIRGTGPFLSGMSTEENIQATVRRAIAQAKKEIT